MSLNKIEISNDGFVRGYGAVFDRVDDGGDIIARGAFSKSLLKRPPAKIRMLYQHDSKDVVGVWHFAQENAFGLYMEGQLLAEVQRGREAAAMLKYKALDGLSIGYSVIRAKPRTKAGVRVLQELDLWEVSLVTFPMQTLARTI